MRQATTIFFAAVLAVGWKAVTPAAIQAATPQKILEVAGDRIADRKLFKWFIAQHPDPFDVSKSGASAVISGTMGFVDAHDSDSGAVQRPAETPARLEFDENSAVDSPDVATLVFDTSPVTYRSLASEISPNDAGDGSLHAAGLVGARLHVLADTSEPGLVYELLGKRVRRE